MKINNIIFLAALCVLVYGHVRSASAPLPHKIDIDQTVHHMEPLIQGSLQQAEPEGRCAGLRRCLRQYTCAGLSCRLAVAGFFVTLIGFAVAEAVKN